jgi:uncharacterized protein (TIGR03086 family)
MDDMVLLEGILTKTGNLLEGVGDDQWSKPTPCPDYDVDALVNHIVGWVQVFEAGSNERAFEGDPTAYRHGEDPADDFRAAATSLVAGWREHGVDREVHVSSGKSPGSMVFNMTLMEYLTHGWDLATATGQPIPFTDEEGALVLEKAEQTLPNEYRGDAFGAIVEVDDDAPGVDRLVAFMGRDPETTT